MIYALSIILLIHVLSAMREVERQDEQLRLLWKAHQTIVDMLGYPVPVYQHKRERKNENIHKEERRIRNNSGIKLVQNRDASKEG